jgi:hypothetical protein
MTSKTDTIIATLGADLRPVRRLAPPAARIATWLLILALAAALLATQVDRHEVARRLLATPDMWLAVLGSVLTTIAAATAAFLVSLPDRSPRWAWLPLPPLLLWQGANGLGCLRAPLPGLHTVSWLQAADDCAPFIILTSLPLAVILLLMLRRATTLRPELTTLMGGLAVASGAASLLWLDHPFDAGAADLLIHAAAVALVVAALRLGGRRLV